MSLFKDLQDELMAGRPIAIKGLIAVSNGAVYVLDEWQGEWILTTEVPLDLLLSDQWEKAPIGKYWIDKNDDLKFEPIRCENCKYFVSRSVFSEKQIVNCKFKNRNSLNIIKATDVENTPCSRWKAKK